MSSTELSPSSCTSSPSSSGLCLDAADDAGAAEEPAAGAGLRGSGGVMGEEGWGEGW